VDRRISLFSQALRKSGLRLTHQRLEVAREIAGSDTHPDVEAIYRGVRDRVPTISLDTVYRTLAALVELGLISRLNATAGPARYDANLTRHHHFVCTRCGLIRDLYSATLDAIRAPERTSAFGRVESVEVQLRGVCEECERKENCCER
jgi:Fur family transcriptional regulator, peroxide stress response regulator